MDNIQRLEERADYIANNLAEWIAREHDYCPNCCAKMDGKDGADQ